MSAADAVRRPNMKDVGVAQAEFRIQNVERDLQTASRDALVQRRAREARDLEMQRRGVSLALDAVEELRRNFRGLE